LFDRATDILLCVPREDHLALIRSLWRCSPRAVDISRHAVTVDMVDVISAVIFFNEDCCAFPDFAVADGFHEAPESEIVIGYLISIRQRDGLI